jgi:hypothetical protein
MSYSQKIEPEDIMAEIMAPKSVHAESLPRKQKRVRKHRERRRIRFGTIFLIFFILCSLTAGGIYFLTDKKVKNPFPEEIRSKATFKLYYPDNLEDKYKVAESSFKMGENNDAILFTIQNSETNTKYEVSLQQYPDGFNFNDFKKKFSEKNETVSPVGSIFVGDVGSQLIASLKTLDNTWVLITASDTNSHSQLESLLGSFRPVN